MRGVLGLSEASLGRSDSVEAVFFRRIELEEDVCDSLVNSTCRSVTCLVISESLEFQTGRFSWRKRKLWRASMTGEVGMDGMDG